MSEPMTKNNPAMIHAKWLKSETAPTVLNRTNDLAAGALIDFGALAIILGTHEPKALNQLLAEFLTASGNLLSEVETAVLSRDAARIRRTAHSAERHARRAAVPRLASLYAELERTTTGGDRAVQRGLAASAGAELLRVKDFIRERLRA